MLKLAIVSLWNRRFVATLTIVSIALSAAIILGSERLRMEARESFANSASGVDLIVAARGSSVQILMASIFGVGSTTTGVKWESYQMIRDLPQVAWAVPISMGDNHRGFPVIGTEPSYFEHFKHSGVQDLRFAQGRIFEDPSGAVIGAEVAARFDYTVGSVIVNAHGAGSVSFDLHDEAPFVISGILEPTRTAVDRMVFVTLEGFDGLHAEETVAVADPFDMSADTDDPVPQKSTSGTEPLHSPDMINAIYVGLNARLAVLSVQRTVSLYPEDALTAVLPAVALLELWSITAAAENALRVMAWVVALAGMLGMVVMLSAALETRRREFAILRSVGVTPSQVFFLIIFEACLLTLAGLFLGIILGVTVMFIAGPILREQFGIHMALSGVTAGEVTLIAIIFSAGVAASLVPATRVYRMTLADGLSIRL